MNRLEILNDILDRHINCLDEKDDPILSDTKTLTELLKATLLLEQIKKIQGSHSKYDELSSEQLEKEIESLS